MHKWNSRRASVAQIDKLVLHWINLPFNSKEKPIQHSVVINATAVVNLTPFWSTHDIEKT